MGKALRLAVLGDSISQGIGSRLYNYCGELKDKLEKYDGIESCVIENFAYTGTTIQYANEIIGRIKEFDPNILLIFYGNVEAMVRPKTTGKPDIWGLLPARYKKNGCIDSRAFYSGNVLKCILQYMDSLIRFILKRILFKLQGTYCWLELDKFRLEYQNLLDAFSNCDCRVFMISTVNIDGFYFPGSPESYEKYNGCIKELAEKNGRTFIDVQAEMKKYDWRDIFGNDHFHPNKNGYTMLAELFSDFIAKSISAGNVKMF